MCCFSRPVQSVTATNIFARAGASGLQFLVYSMSLKAKEELAMVLPLPVKPGNGERAVQFIDLSGYKEFFDDLLKGFPVPLTASAGTSRAALPPAAVVKLEVVSVGSFDASFVPTIEDFARLDERFRLPPGTWETLPAYRTYGFAVFKLKPGAATVHPMAFSFLRTNPRELFFPTVHIHDGKLHDKADFDHTLYCQRTSADSFTLTDWEESPRPALAFMTVEKSRGIIDGSAHCHKKRILGRRENKDTIVGIA
jgi:hypothetical protein